MDKDDVIEPKLPIRMPNMTGKNIRPRQAEQEIVVAMKYNAQEIINILEDDVQLYGFASLNELYDLVGITGNFKYEHWGWTDLTNASITKVKDGYLLNLPMAEYLD